MGNPKTCRVLYNEPGGIPHSVEVTAETFYEAAVRAIKAFRESGCEPGAGARLAIEVRTPAAIHEMTMWRLNEWLAGSGRSPKDVIEKRRLREMLAR